MNVSQGLFEQAIHELLAFQKGESFKVLGHNKDIKALATPT